MYARLKIVYENKKSFCIEVVSENEDDFYYQLLTAFKNGESKYNPSDYDQFSISYVEKGL